MASFAVLFLAVCFFAAEGRFVRGSDVVGNDIPALCISSSVTPVTCGAVGPDSLVPHPDDCRLFYYCVSDDQPPVCRQCPADLHFNPTEHVCDTPEHAGCRRAKVAAIVN